MTSYNIEKPTAPPAFCMALRKHLRNAWLRSVEQYEFERVGYFTFRTSAGVVQLVLELFGDGNMILVDENDRILQALTYKYMRDRNIVRNETFAFAPPSGRNPSKVSREELLEGLRSYGSLEAVRGLTRFLSIGGIYAEEVLSRAGIDKTKQCDMISEEEANPVFDELQGLLQQVTGGVLEPCVVVGDADGFMDVTPFRLRRYDCEGFKLQPYASFNDALDEFFTRVTTVEKSLGAVKIEQLRQEAERLRRIVTEQERGSVEAETNVAKDRQVGDTIYAHSGELESLLKRFSSCRQSGQEWDKIASEITEEKKMGVKPSIYFESFDNRRSVVNVCVNGLRFGLNVRGNLFENAARFYENYKQTKQKLSGIVAALEETRERLREVEAKMTEVETLEQSEPKKVAEELSKRKVRRKEWFEKFRRFVSSDGFLVVAGKDAVTNEILIKKYTDPKDAVFHADIEGAPFVAVKTGGRQPSEQVLLEAAEFAAAFSRGWREGFASVDVYWVKPDQLSKSGPSGEYVARGAFMVAGKRNWTRNIPLRVAIGVVTNGQNAQIQFVGGSLDAVKAKTKAYVSIVPGDVAGKELLKQTLGILAGKVPKDQREKVLRASIEEIRELIPYGKGRILEE
jgi:predicted ribosome quality control (RQC) complex YloA/Tae2 family protein